MAGKRTSRKRTANCAIRKGSTPLNASSMLILATPDTTFSTVPTGGVIATFDHCLDLGARVPGLREDEKSAVVRADRSILAGGELDEQRATGLLAFADELLVWFRRTGNGGEIAQPLVDLLEQVLISSGALLSFLA